MNRRYEDAVEAARDEALDRVAELEAEIFEARADYLRVHKDSVDHFERAVAAEARATTTVAMNERQKKLIEELQANRDAWWKAKDAAEAERNELAAQLKWMTGQRDEYMANAKAMLDVVEAAVAWEKARPGKAALVSCNCTDKKAANQLQTAVRAFQQQDKSQ